MGLATHGYLEDIANLIRASRVLQYRLQGLELRALAALTSPNTTDVDRDYASEDAKQLEELMGRWYLIQSYTALPSQTDHS